MACHGKLLLQDAICRNSLATSHLHVPPSATEQRGWLQNRGVQHAEVFIFNEFIHIAFKMLELGESPLFFRITGEPVSNNAVAVLASTLKRLRLIYTCIIFWGKLI